MTKKNPFYGDDYLSYTFGQDFWNTRLYIPQAQVCAMPGAAYNETHWDNQQFTDLVKSAARETDAAKRTTLLQDAMQMEYDEGGYIIWGFKQQLDAYSNLVQGMRPSRYLPCGSFKFQRVSFV